MLGYWLGSRQKRRVNRRHEGDPSDPPTDTRTADSEGRDAPIFTSGVNALLDSVQAAGQWEDTKLVR